MVKSSQYAERLGLKKGPWTPEEDHKLLAYIQVHGHGRWQTLPAKAGLRRCGKSCRFRWINYLRPDIKRGKFTSQEEQTIIQLHALLGNRWSIIANHLHRRTDNEIKNYWNTHLRKRLDRMGIDPVTHKPKAIARFTFPSGRGTTKEAANLSHLAQWESARLEAEARQVREAKIVSNPLQNPLRSSSSAPGQLPTSNVKTAAAYAPGKPRCLDVLKAWERVVAGMFFVPGGSLESPTSMLNFSEVSSETPLSGAINPTGVGFNDNFLESAPNWDQHQMPVQGEATLLDEKTMCASETAAAIAGSFRSAAALAVEANTVVGNGVMEGLAEILVCRSDDNNKNSNNKNQLESTATAEPENTDYQSCGGNLEENRIYWSSLCNPMDALPLGSDML